MKYEAAADGIATITWDVPGRPMNVLNRESIAACAEMVENAISDPAVKGVIVTSSRPEFLAGGDLDLIRTMRTAQEALDLTKPLGDLFRRMETCGKPFVAAINGTALGGGLELSLACHRRIVADDPKIQIGTPEVTVGLLPGAGGTQRLPRMIGIKNALPYLMEGRKVGPQAAKGAGIVDEVVPVGALLARARAWLLAEGAASVVKPWDAKGFKFPGGTPQSPGPTQLFFGIPGALMGKTQGIYPAPEAILACVYDGCQVDIDTGLRIEQRQFAALAVRPETKNMIRTLFYSIPDANRLVGQPKDVPARKLTRIAVLGAGMMGAGIAHVSAQAGLQVVLLDMTQEAAEKGRAYGAKLLDAQVVKGRITQELRDQTLALVTPTTDYAQLAGCELVIEAVFENAQVKAGVTRRAEEVLGDGVIFASNTSTLPITGLARNSNRPAQFVGLHFFSPVEKMPLVEVVRGEQTGDMALALAMDYVKRIRKTPIVVNDCPAFYCNRAFGMYPYEAMAMLGEGVNPNLIENAGRFAGMPMPPLALIDEFSAELLYHAMREAQAREGAAYKPQPQDTVLVKVVEQLDRKGRKTGRGFYEYTADGGKQLWSGLAEHFPPAAEQPTLQEVQQRLMLSQSLEAARCVAEGIVSAPDADVGSLLAWGFPAALGGVISQIDMHGAAAFVSACDALAARHGERYAVPQALRDMARHGGRYHAL